MVLSFGNPDREPFSGFKHKRSASRHEKASQDDPEQQELLPTRHSLERDETETSRDDDETTYHAGDVDIGVCPDGGREAWTVLLGVSCGACATFGLVNAWSVFEAYYEQSILQHKNPSHIAWIGYFQYAFVFMPGLIFGRLFDIGYLRLPVAAASILLVIGIFVMAHCTEYYQLLLVQGYWVGIASGAIFTAGISVIPHWFDRNIGLAFGCMALGSTIGGTLFPLLLKGMIEHLSFEWTVRIVGLIVAALLVVTNITINRRLPPKRDGGSLFSVTPLQDPLYAVYVIALISAFLGLYTCLTYISLSGLISGLDLDNSFYLLPIVYASSAIGNISGGMLSDHIGPLNVLIPATFIAGVMTLAWPFAGSKGALTGIAVFYGVSSGPLVALMAYPLHLMGRDVRDVGKRFGTALTVVSFGALAGQSLAGTIFAQTGCFRPLAYYSEAMIVASVVLMVVVRRLTLKNAHAVWRA